MSTLIVKKSDRRTKFPYFKHVTKIKKENLKPKFAYQIDLTVMKEEKQKPGSFSVFTTGTNKNK
jgi:hypothetical protein